jgi:hypothetical protein
MTEAIEAVGSMLVAYPNAKTMVADGYYGAIASILIDYPRQVALRCCSPKHGVAATTSFIPTAADVIKWLEREQETLKSAFAWEKRSSEQFAQRDRDTADDKAEPLEYRRKVAERIKRELKEAFERGDGLKPNVFVPTTAPQYAEMCKRAEQEPPERAQYGHSFEDRTRMGILVPLDWLKPSRARRPETPEEAKARVMAKYNITREQWVSIPNRPERNDYWQGVRWPT